MSVPSDTNGSLKIFGELSKYKDLEIEVTKMWHLKTTTLPVVIGVLGMEVKIPPETNSTNITLFLKQTQTLIANSPLHITRPNLTSQQKFTPTR